MKILILAKLTFYPRIIERQN